MSEHEDFKISELWKKAYAMNVEVDIELTKSRAPIVNGNWANINDISYNVET